MWRPIYAALFIAALAVGALACTISAAQGMYGRTIVFAVATVVLGALVSERGQ